MVDGKSGKAEMKKREIVTSATVVIKCIFALYLNNSKINLRNADYRSIILFFQIKTNR
jgi:hypothetical protein